MLAMLGLKVRSSFHVASISMPLLCNFRQFFDLGRLVRCVLPLGNGCVMHSGGGLWVSRR